MDHYYAQAEAHLDKVGLPQERKQALHLIAQELMNRRK
jgi:geranylgeranyl pyrophosphate synthase